MLDETDRTAARPVIPRRAMLGIGVAASAVIAGLGRSQARPEAATTQNALAVDPPSVVSTPPRQWGDKAPIAYTPDPDVISLDPAFDDLVFGNAAITQAWHGNVDWLEGPAWSIEGRFLLVSDVVGSTQYRFIAENGTLSVFRKQSYHSNGNTFDREGRLLTCEHDLRRVIRWEHDGRCTVLADSYNGKRLNSPNDIVVHPVDGSIWFTDPPYGVRLWEGHPDAPRPDAPTPGHLRWNLDTEITGEVGGTEHQETHVFRIDPVTKALTAVTNEMNLIGTNGLCFSPDNRTLYVASSEKGARAGGGGYRNIYAFDVADGRLSNQRVFCDMMLAGQKLMPDGIRSDVVGNIWVGASGPLGLCGVFVYNPAGKMIGRLRMPRGISNLAFGGTQRDLLYMCARDTIFTLQVATQGAGLA